MTQGKEAKFGKAAGWVVIAGVAVLLTACSHSASQGPGNSATPAQIQQMAQQRAAAMEQMHSHGGGQAAPGGQPGH